MKKMEFEWSHSTSFAHRLMKLIKDNQMESEEWKTYESLFGGKEGLKRLIKRQLEKDKGNKSHD